MESTEPTGVEKLSKRERIQHDMRNKYRSLQDESETRRFAFSHGRLLLKTATASIFGNFLVGGLSFFLLASGASFVRRERPKNSISFLHLYFTHYAIQLCFLLAGTAAIEMATVIFRLSGAKQLTLYFIYLLLVFGAPTIFFHWSFMGN